MVKIVLESPVFTVEAALNAAAYGVDRLELCSSFSEGGETPGAGMFRYLKERLSIPVFVMIRPRGGNFVYSENEIEVMKEEIRIFSSLGADGFVFGVLNPDGTVHKNACKTLVKTADRKPCTFHRAFDVSADLMKSMEAIMDCGFKRILTSGGKDSVEKGLPVIKELLTEAKDRIIIIPGGGMKPEFAEPLRETGNLKEIHASCKKIIKKEGNQQRNDVQFSINKIHSNKQLTIDPQQVAAFRHVLERNL